MSYFLQLIDQFGVQQKLQIPRNQTNITKLFRWIRYFLFQFVDWQQNNKLPKVTSLQQQINVEQKLKLQGVFAEISYFQELSHQIDPFDPQNMILQPLLVSSSSYYDVQLFYFLVNTYQCNFLIQENLGRQNIKYALDRRYYNFKFANKFIGLQIYQLSINLYILQSRITLRWIKMRKLRFNQQILLIRYNYFQILIYLEQFDPRNKQITKIPKFFVFEMMQKSYFQNMFTLKSGDLIMDDGFLFPNSNQQTFLSDLSILTTQFDQEYAQKVYGQDIIAVLYFDLDQVKTVNMVEYPKISEILADTGSIISWILSISFIVSKYNENLSNDKAQKDIITMYYHDFNDFLFQKNWMGQIKKVNYKGKDYDLKKSIEILNKLDSIAIKKMNYLNLQNEVAKLQLILQEHLGIQQIKKYLQSQYKLESLFDKLGIPDINRQSSLNQIVTFNQQFLVMLN
ncbi:unnamed protein product (macronuclear) [Paramecium tetraurelia]|uniref:Uncharacterized protein n=1 Tax=Paramecium tetraurelia TaxID=5888 RepID=A0EDQ4_PARTE|nr:uncharacterized protein GSPATT00025765001 [Paramecium tetraurelia]CAK93421.1 unnamed protein product [Paramecium tetraurelia]|eukprot:XP_001460818.1 hypothetical protein (macronuclear) [Paramecium tetraurelia strain d4-2]